MSDLKFMGVTDERDACDCCGKSGLKRVVVFKNNNSGEFEFRGSSCALKAHKFLNKGIIKKANQHLDAFKKGSLAKWSESFKNIQNFTNVLTVGE